VTVGNSTLNSVIHFIFIFAQKLTDRNITVATMRQVKRRIALTSEQHQEASVSERKVNERQNRERERERTTVGL